MPRCPECASTKMCNPATGRCVLKNGKIGLALTGNAKPKSKKPAAKNAVRPLTKAEVVASFPKLQKGWSDDLDFNSMKQVAEVGYGSFVRPLSKALALKYMGKDLVSIGGRSPYQYDPRFPHKYDRKEMKMYSWSYPDPAERVNELMIIRPIMFTDNRKELAIDRDGDRTVPIYFPTAAHGVTGYKKQDPIYVFVGKPSQLNVDRFARLIFDSRA